MGAIGARRVVIGLIGVAAIAAPIGASMFIAQQQGLNRQRDRAEHLAETVLSRAEAIRRQLGAAFARLDKIDAAPCSDRGLTEMRAVALGSDHLAGVGFIAEDMLLCSSFGRHDNGVPVGPPDYRGQFGIDVRTRRELPNAPGPRLLLVANPRGYASLIYPERTIAIAEEDPSVSLYVSARRSGQPLAMRGSFEQEWMREASESDGLGGWNLHPEHIVAWRASATWDLVAVAAIHRSQLSREIEQIVFILTPVGLLAGSILFLAGYYTVQQNSSLQSVLRAAIRRNELRVHYQPIVNLSTGRWVGVEALLRWRRPSGEEVAPDIFIPIAERHGLLGLLTRRVVEIATGEIAPIVGRDPDFFVALNMGASELMSHQLRSHLRECVQRHGLQPKNIHIELTEREPADSEEISQAIGAYRVLGVEIAADDFGVGYANLFYLEGFNLDCIKIDRLFLTPEHFQTGRKQTIAHMIEMVQERNIRLIVEGIESEQQLAFLKEHGVEFGQGWFFARAMPIDELEQALLGRPVAGVQRPPAISGNAPVT
ncbi:diguanylate phosphodiesterase [Allostella sp. ATCC 35155]|nr:diguanylate phosphodiesterase [Stella sp. ATCC 35155]